MTEIRYVEGLYAMWDEMRERCPGLFIDNCASGGRRIDLETIRRAHTFWKSDETSNVMAARFQETGGNRLLPGGLLNTNLPASCKPTQFELHSLFAGPLGFATDWTRLDASAKDRVRKEIAVYKKVRHLLNKDYYPLFPQTLDLAQWVAWEFVDPDGGEGVVTALRPAESSYSAAELRLQGVDSSKAYRLTRLDDGTSQTVSGRQLQAGFAVSLSPSGSQVLYFQVQPSSP